MPVSLHSIRGVQRPRSRFYGAWARLGALLCLALAAAPLARAGTRDMLVPLMAGEYALQAGQLDAAARWYLAAAQAAEDDAALAERATRIALLANDDLRTAQSLRLWRQRAPQSEAMRAAIATLALREGRLRKARRELEALLRSPDPRGWRYALSALGGGRDPDRIARVLGWLVDDGAIPGELPAWQEFGRLALRLDDAALTRRIVDQLADRFPEEPRVAVLRAGQLQQAGRDQEARAMLRQAEPRAEHDPEVRAMLAMAYESLRDYGQAARVMAMGAQDTTTYSVRASLLARTDDTDTLGALYSELAADASKPDPSRRLLLGRIAEFLKRPAEAVGWYRGVPGGPQRNEARMRTAVALHELDRKDEAYAEARALQDEIAASGDMRRDAYLLEAELRQRAGEGEAELDALDRGLAAWPDDTHLLYARALAWERRDRIDRAEADLRRLLVSEPENVAALNALGYTLADRTTRYQEALELIDRARVAEPDDAAIADSYGWVLYRLGRHEEALVELRRAWGMMKDPEIGAHVGEVLWVLGRREEAQRYFDEARRLDPDNRALRRALQRFGLPGRGT
ncbi:tetratricopeptide repeat protein [Pseudoxanthomonas broegbernensis]|uniref:tetratricopeptide repeat protein n=1 Tax=Pseudoxanthomonas broegbernensis TaxID=83619 RepID=UPI0018593260|nr:tetratricopeptide repeat protein [Pseudoxanthomonas broegbernensis]MBB6064331.1 putative Zn-dependent protease [Pseudoxanthomonas broegbernensis]